MFYSAEWRGGKVLYTLSLVTGRDVQWLSSQLRTEGPRPRLTPSSESSLCWPGCAQLTPSSEHKQSAAPTRASQPTGSWWNLLGRAEKCRVTEHNPGLPLAAGQVLGPSLASFIRGLSGAYKISYLIKFEKSYDSLQWHIYMKHWRTKLKYHKQSMNTLKVSFYKIITHTRLRAMLDNLASVLELANSQLLHDYGIRVSILFSAKTRRCILGPYCLLERVEK